MGLLARARCSVDAARVPSEAGAAEEDRGGHGFGTVAGKNAAAQIAGSSANANVVAPATNFVAAMRLALEMLKEPAFSAAEFDRAIRSGRTHPVIGGPDPQSRGLSYGATRA